MQERLRRLLREPLAHFVGLGLLLFVAFDVVGGNRGVESRRIVIDDGVVADLYERFAGTWQRPPTPEEMRGLLEGYVQEEILYRDGVANGMLEDDPVIRRRVRQKVDVLAEEALRGDPPSDSELQTWLDTHAERYAEPPLLSFTQVLFDPTRLGSRTDAAITAAKARLVAGADAASVGARTLLPTALARVSPDRVTRDFGEEFGEAIANLPVGSWEGPVRSGFGLHLVRLTAREPGRRAALAEVRRAVERDWENDRRERAAAAYYRNLLRDFEVVIEADLPEAARPAAPKS
jgi:parvulin-like peptidyl-prolyl isomerase